MGEHCGEDAQTDQRGQRTDRADDPGGTPRRETGGAGGTMSTGALPARPSPTSDASKKVEIWGGVECTVNRVGDRYFDQLALSGHAERIEEDLERIASLGIR